MKLSLRISLISLIYTYAGIVICQQPASYFSSPPDVIPPSPHVASLAKYAEIPVNLYTGVPDISIPLYEVKQGDLSIPITLSYHAAGHRVQEHAGHVGLGWSLNAGGVVGRTVRGLEDEAPFGYQNTISTILNWKSQGNLWWLSLGSETGYDDPSQYPQYTGIAAFKDTQHAIKQVMKDTQSDLFFFNYPGGAGKFRINHDNSVIQLPYGERKIVWNGFTSNSISIHDPNGYKYTFGKTEESGPVREENSNDHYTAWFLTSVRSAGGESISFSYAPHTEDRIIQPSQSYRYRLDGLDRELEDIPASASKKSSSDTQHLTRIDWDGGHVEFTYSNSRPDLEGGQGKRLDEIAVYNSDDDLIKKWKLKYGYFTWSGNNYNHLKLESVTEVSASGEENPPYRFDYNGNPPPASSFAMDHYGFYNGAVTNTDLIPPFYTNWQTEFGTANREVRASYVDKGILTTIHYPAGGRAEFNYESNKFYLPTETPEYEESIRAISTAAVAWNCGGNGEINDPDGNICLEENGGYVITEEAQIPSDADEISLNLRKIFNYEECGETTATTLEVDDEIWFRILKKNAAGDFVELIKLNHYDFGTLTGCGGQSIYEFEFPFGTDLGPGDVYKLEAKSTVENTMIGGTLTYLSAIQTQGGQGISCCDGGGLRIASISRYDGINASPEITSYEYNLQSNPNRTSGQALFIEKTHQDKKVELIGDGNGEYLPYEYIYVHADPVGFLGSYEEAPVVYTEVVERKVGYGYSRHFFSFTPNGRLISSGLPEGLDNGVPQKIKLQSFFWKRGKPIKTEIYNEDDELTRATENAYEFVTLSDSVISFEYEVYRDLTIDPTFKDVVFSYAFESQHSGWARIKKTTNYDFFASDTVISSATYAYKSDTYYTNPVSITNDYEDASKSFKKSYTYYEQNSPLYSRSLPQTITRSQLSGEQLDKTELVYGYLGNVETIRQYDESNTQIAETSISYETNSRPNEIIKPDGTITSVIYEGMYPKVIGKGVSLSVLETAYSALGDNLRNHSSLADAHILTYLYKPLIGPEKVIDPNGVETNYQYDDFGRLKSISDQNGDVLKFYEYRFDPANY